MRRDKTSRQRQRERKEGKREGKRERERGLVRIFPRVLTGPATNRATNNAVLCGSANETTEHTGWPPSIVSANNETMDSGRAILMVGLYAP